MTSLHWPTTRGWPVNFVRRLPRISTLDPRSRPHIVGSVSADSIYHLVYVSAEAVPFTEQMLRELLDRARSSNAALGVTGLLLYKDHNFIQVLEGSRETVSRLFDKIRRDPRHRNPIVLDEGEFHDRQFPDWAMGFRHTAGPDVRALPGFSDFLAVPITPEHYHFDPKGVLAILEIFRRGGP